MKIRILVTLAVVLSLMWLLIPVTRTLAQNGAGCSGRCETQYQTCHAGAEAVLEDCLDRAVGAHEKAVCAAAFVKLEDACRATESACLSNCPSS